MSLPLAWADEVTPGDAPAGAPATAPSAPGGLPAGAFDVIDAVRAENGDADLAYVRAAMARNEAAIAAAKAVLKTSYDAEVRMMAGDSMKLHDTELRIWQNWMSLYGPNPAYAQEAKATAVSEVTEAMGVTPNDTAAPSTALTPQP